MERSAHREREVWQTMCAIKNPKDRLYSVHTHTRKKSNIWRCWENKQGGGNEGWRKSQETYWVRCFYCGDDASCRWSPPLIKALWSKLSTHFITMTPLSGTVQPCGGGVGAGGRGCIETSSSRCTSERETWEKERMTKYDRALEITLIYKKFPIRCVYGKHNADRLRFLLT